MRIELRGVSGWSTTLWKSDTVRFVFDSLNVGNSNPCSKTNAEVTPTDVYIMRSRSVPRAYYALTHTLGCIVYTHEGIKSACSFKGGFRRPKLENEQQEIPSFFLYCSIIKVKTIWRLGISQIFCS